MKKLLILCLLCFCLFFENNVYAYSSDNLVTLKGGLGLRITPAFIITANHLIPHDSRLVTYQEGYYTKLGFVISSKSSDDLALIMTSRPSEINNEPLDCTQYSSEANFFIKNHDDSISKDKGILVPLKLIGNGTYNIMKVTKPTGGSSGSPIFDERNNLIGIVSSGGTKNPFVGYTSCDTINSFLISSMTFISLITK